MELLWTILFGLFATIAYLSMATAMITLLVSAYKDISEDFVGKMMVTLFTIGVLCIPPMGIFGALMNRSI